MLATRPFTAPLRFPASGRVIYLGSHLDPSDVYDADRKLPARSLHAIFTPRRSTNRTAQRHWTDGEVFGNVGFHHRLCSLAYAEAYT